jgi:predicted metal-dependent peptidase
MFALNNGPYLPSQIDTNSTYGTLIIARDESGSMSDNECRQAAGIIADAKAYYKKIILIKHDTEIKSVFEFEDMNDEAMKVLLTRESYGGTSHKDVFKWIKDYQYSHQDEDKISCCIFISDLYSDIENYQDDIQNVPLIYISPKDSVKKFQSSIKGILIPIE